MERIRTMKDHRDRKPYNRLENVCESASTERRLECKPMSRNNEVHIKRCHLSEVSVKT